jgi:PAS domain S-box-containing protein
MDKAQIRSLLGAMASENELLEVVLDSMTDGVLVTDRQHRILVYNKSSERLIPFSQPDLAEKVVWEVITDREVSRFLKERLQNQEKVIDQEFTLVNGFTRTLSCSLMPVVRDGRIQGTLIHIEDVTEKRAKEARLRRAENLAALTTLTAGVAHEIKNPLASIGIHLQLIRKEMADRDRIETGRISEYLDIIHEEVDRLNRIVVDFLFAVRPMDTRLELDDVNRVIRELLEFIKFELQEAGITLDLQLSPLIPKTRLDEKYMKQALLNIFKNAISAMPEGGVLRIETLQEGEDLLVKIGDTGVGISEEIIGKIFEPYFTTKEFGSGLGLTLVYKIIKEHRGEIAVSSEVGEGTVFTLSFPIPQEEKRLIPYEGETYEV